MSRGNARAGDAAGFRVAVTDGVAWWTLARPECGNRLSESVAAAVCGAAEAVEDDDGVRIVVLDAVGPAFCLGFEDPGGWTRRHDAVAAVARLTRPVVAAVRGDAVAEGCELALACDLRVVAEPACFALPHLTEGRFPAHGATQRLPRCVGRMRALDLLLTGRRVTAAEAEAIGLATRCVPEATFDADLRALVQALADKGPLALRFAKEAVLSGSDMTLAQGIRLEEDLYVLLQTTADRREGVAAFLEKRPPVFRGV